MHASLPPLSTLLLVLACASDAAATVSNLSDLLLHASAIIRFLYDMLKTTQLLSLSLPGLSASRLEDDIFFCAKLAGPPELFKLSKALA